MNGLITDIGTGDLLVEHKRAVVTDSDGQTVEAVMLGRGSDRGRLVSHDRTTIMSFS